MFCIGVFLACRLLFSAVGVLGIRSTTPPPSAASDTAEQPVAGSGLEIPATPGWHNAIDGSLRWDAAWYIRIADEGYGSRPTAAFFPGYVLAIRAVDLISPLGSTGAALLVSNGAFLAALLAVYALTCREYDDRHARRTVLLIAFFPTSFFFLAPYPESPFLLLAVLTFWAVRADRWAIGGLTGAFASATRITGVALVPALLLERWNATRSVHRLAVALVPCVGIVAFIAWSVIASPSDTSPLEAQDVWHRELAFPLVTLGRGVGVGLRAIGDPSWLPEAGDVVLTVPPMALLVGAWRRLPAASYGVYALFGFLVPLAFAVPDRPLLSLSRHILALFPLAWLGASVARSTTSFGIVLAICISGWVGLAYGFVNWSFVA
jgi:Mannosyltransferase (PIG-V)